MKKELKIGKGIEITLANEFRAELEVQDDGYLGVLPAGIITVTVTVDRTARLRGEFYGLETDGKQNVILKRDWDRDSLSRKYIRGIRVRTDDDNVPYTAYPENHFKLLELYKGGHFRIWEIAITMRGRVFYLSTQAVWDEWAYRDGETVVLPAMKQGWETLRKVFFMSPKEWDDKDDRRKVLAKKNKKPDPKPLNRSNLLDPKNLEPVSNYLPKPAITAFGLKNGQGRVIWWNEANGLGALSTTQGVARFHRKNLAVTYKWVTFEKGEIVTFGRLSLPKLKNEESHTTFKLEAFAVASLPFSIEGAAIEAMMDMASSGRP